MEMTVDEMKNEITELAGRINNIGTYDVAATNLPEELEHLNALNDAAENYKQWCKEVLRIRQDQNRMLSLEGTLVSDIS
jgi:hypothetical protein